MHPAIRGNRELLDTMNRLPRDYSREPTILDPDGVGADSPLMILLCPEGRL